MASSTSKSELPAPFAPGNPPTTVLLVEDDPTEAARILEALAASLFHRFRVEWVRRLADAQDRLGKNASEVVLLDLMLADAQGIAVFTQIFAVVPDSVILVLSTADDEEDARQAVRSGAQDYLVKGHVDAHWLPRALRYLIERKAARDALLQSEVRFRTMSDASPLGIFVSDAQGSCVYTNAAYHKISGLNLEETLDTRWSMAVHPDDRQRIVAEWRDAVRGQEPYQTEVRFQRADGSIVWTRLNAAAMREGATSRGRVQIVEDITERKAAELRLRQAEEALFEEKERAQVTLNSIGDAVLTTGLLGEVTYMNVVAETMTGWPWAEAMGRPLTEIFRIIDGKTREAAENPAHQAIAEDRTVGLAMDSVLVSRNGSESAIEDSAAPIHNRDGKVAGAVIVFHDVSESRAMAKEMSHLAQHDFLTGLPNRLLLTERLSRSIGLAHRHRKQVALLFLDLDYFKNINDSLGHAVGDQLLQSVAERLVACVRTTDTVCRQGGDEFVILLAEIEAPADAAQVAEKLLAALVTPHRIDGHELHVTLSIGISIFPDDGINAETAIQNADTAMYYAKENGRNNYQFFTADMNARAVQRLLVENSLRRALKQDEFELYYQPKINLASGLMTGAEALIRWQDPELGLVYPRHFVPIAEECGLIVPIGRWVLREACRQLKAWLDAGLPAVPVAVNISAVEFRHPHFLEGVALILEETALPAHYLELELTESFLMHDAESSASLLEQLKAMDIQLAIDDFGTGYSSLSYLNRFPIDTLKIDQSFVRNIASNAHDASIVKAVIGMGKNLNQRVIAEGVENPEQLAVLRLQQCEEGQGYLFSHPLPAKDFALLLKPVEPGASIVGRNDCAVVQPVIEGKTMKQKVLFLPGLLNDASLFQGQITALAGLAAVAVADLTHADSIAGLAAEVFKEAPAEPFVLIGLSMGGYVAFEIMRQAPERVRALVLLDTSARPDTPEGIAARQELMQLASTDLDAVTERLLPRLSHPDRVSQPTVRGVIQSMAASLGKDVFIRQQQAIIGRPDSRPDLARIKCPTLVICGRQDLITPPEVAEEIVAGIEHSTLELVEQCGHLSTLDQPEAVAKLLADWIKNLTGSMAHAS